MAEWACSDYRPCHYVAVDRARRRIVLAIRGSLEPGDFLTDFTGAPLEFQFGPTGAKFQAHQVRAYA